MHRLPALLLLAVLAAGCTDQALVDRIAQLEVNAEELRDTVRDLEAPSDAGSEGPAAIGEELEAVAARIAAVEGEIEALTANLDGQTLELDGRLTTTELQLDEARAELTQLRADLTTLTDRVSSLEVQLEAHLSDHGG